MTDPELRPAPRRSFPVAGVVILGLILVALATAAYWAGRRSPAPVPESTPAIAAPDRASFAPLVQRAAPAVVNIAVLQPSPAEQNPLLRDPFYRRYFGIPDAALEPRLSAGSGVIVDARRGLVLTNRHVVAGARAVEVTLRDRRRLPARLLGADAATDIALLQVRASQLSELPLGDSDALQVGDHVVAIGNPFGIGQTVTAGIVSALDRGLTADGYESYVQTDAPINPGNSGGPLIDLSGRIIGINSAIIGPGANVGIGFAVPSNSVRFVVNQILAHGEVRRGQIGIAVTDTIARSDAPPPVGALVAAVQPGGAAAQAGLRAGDLVTSANGRPTPTAATLRNTIGVTPVGETLTLQVKRGDTQSTVRVAVQPSR